MFARSESIAFLARCEPQTLAAMSSRIICTRDGWLNRDCISYMWYAAGIRTVHTCCKE
jgi:hypothetical protein